VADLLYGSASQYCPSPPPRRIPHGRADGRAGADAGGRVIERDPKDRSETNA